MLHSGRLTVDMARPTLPPQHTASCSSSPYCHHPTDFYTVEAQQVPHIYLSGCVGGAQHVLPDSEAAMALPAASYALGILDLILPPEDDVVSVPCISPVS